MSFFGNKTEKPSSHQKAWFHMRGSIWEYWQATGGNRTAYQRTLAAIDKALFDLKMVVDGLDKEGDSQ